VKAEKFYRACHAHAVPVVAKLKAKEPLTEADATTLSLAVGALKDVVSILADHEAQAKARRERIQWVCAGNGAHVAAVGRGLVARMSRVTEGEWSLSIRDAGGRAVVYLGTVHSIEGATRKVRAWRKAQKRRAS